MSKVDGHLLRTRDLEWYEIPMPVVGMVGRPDLHAAIVKGVPQVHSLRFLTINLADHRFPPKSHKRLIYDGYEPPGLLKNSWITKHLKRLPAVCLLLVDFEEGKNPEHQESEIAAMFLTLKELAHCPTYMKIIVVLIRQQHSDDEAHYLDRFSRWSKRMAGLDGARSFLFLSLQAMKIDLKKLESMAFDFSQNVYTSLAKAVKSHKHKVNKSSQQSLYVRHHFKIAFYAEAVNDLVTAHKYYVSSSTFLKQLMFNIRGGSAIEIKSVADLLNYKICRILIALRRINEAQEQFRQHVKYYQLIPGLTDAQFIHHAWMATQYCTFADMLDSLPPAVFVRNRQTNNGYLYETAATYTFKRRQAALEANVQTSSFIAERNTFGPAVYLGQPLTTKVGEEVKEKPSDHSYLTSALTEEKGVDHTQLGISLLTRALEIFKKEKANRMILHIAAQMANEHLYSKQYQVAKQYFDRIVRTYRSDMWFSILNAILRSALNCGTKLDSSRDVVTNILELLTRNPDDKINLFRQLQTLIVDEQAKDTATTTTTVTSPSVPSSSSLVLASPFLCSILTCSVHFQTNPVVEVKETVEFVLSIKSGFPMTVKFSKIVIVSSNENYTFTLLSNNDDSTQVGQLSASEVKTPEQVLFVAASTPTLAGATRSLEILTDTLFSPNSTRVFRINFQTFVTTLPQTPLQFSHLLFSLPSPSSSPSPATKSSSLVLQCPCITASYEPVLPVPSIPVPVVDENFKSYVTLRGVESQKTFGEAYWGRTVPSREENQQQIITRRNALDIAPAKPKAYFEVDQSGPALVDEYHCLMLSINSNGDCMRNAHVKFECLSDVKNEQDDAGTSASTTNVGGGNAPTATANTTTNPSTESGTERLHYSDFGLPDPDPKHIFFHYLDGEKVLVPIVGLLNLPSLEAQSTHKMPVYVCGRLRRPHVLTVTMTITYDNGEGVSLTYTASFPVTVEVPFKIRARYFSDIPVPKILNDDNTIINVNQPSKGKNNKTALKYPPMLLAGQECILYVEVENNSSHPIAITSLNVSLPLTSSPTSMFTLDARLACGDRHTVKFPFRPALGQLTGALCVRWSRLSETPNSFEQAPVSVTRMRAVTSMRGLTNETTIHTPIDSQYEERDKPLSLTPIHPLFAHHLPDNHFLEVLPMCEIRAPPLQVSVKFPPRGAIGRTFLMRVTVTNHTTSSQVVAATLETSPAMAVSGLRSTSFTLAPSDRSGIQKMELVYRLAPLQCGYIPLPKVQLKSLPSKAPLLDPGDLGYVFIVPNEKSASV